jgi:tRNA threonylcarbamoyladenosine dehydratase
MDPYQSRFSGIARLYGLDGLEKLRQAHVIVIGVGGVGSWAAEAIARSGVNQISLMDMDDVCVTNTNRQLHALQSNIGMQKIDCMAERLQQINPEIKVNLIDDFLSQDNIVEHIGKDIDFVIDAIDSVPVKAALIAHCKRQKIPIITTGAAGGQLDPTQITIGDLNKTFNDPLAKKTRSMLRRHHNFSRNPKRTYSVPCVYSQEQLKYPKPDGTVCGQKFIAEGETKLDCSGGFGAATMVTATFGLVAASHVVKKITQV